MAMYRCCLFVYTAMAAVASVPLQEGGGSSASFSFPFTSMFYSLDSRGDIIVSNSTTRFLKNIRMGIQPHQHITVVGCATKSNVFHPVEVDTEAVFSDVVEEEMRNYRNPCADKWEGFDLLSDYSDDDMSSYNKSSVECGTIFEKNFSPEGIFWKGSPSGLMTVSSGKVEDNGPINIIWSGKEDDDGGRGCAEAKIYFEPSDEAMTLFEVAFLIGSQERLMRVSILGDKEKETVAEEDISGGDKKDTVIILLASILGAIGFAAFLFLTKGYIYTCLVYIVARTCARRYPI